MPHFFILNSGSQVIWKVSFSIVHVLGPHRKGTGGNKVLLRIQIGRKRPIKSSLFLQSIYYLVGYTDLCKPSFPYPSNIEFKGGLDVACSIRAWHIVALNDCCFCYPDSELQSIHQGWERKESINFIGQIIIIKKKLARGILPWQERKEREDIPASNRHNRYLAKEGSGGQADWGWPARGMCLLQMGYEGETDSIG